MKSASSRRSRAAKAPALRPSRSRQKAGARKSADPVQKTRLWLTYPQKHIRAPVLWQLCQKFNVITNIRQASVTEQIGIVSVELEGARTHIKAAIKWLERKGIQVEPVEISVIES